MIAGLYFFKYSVDHGLLTTTLRVVLGTALGTGCIIASELPLRKRYAVLADWVGGAGVAILYLSFWAAAARYDLIPIPVSFALMAAVTALACVLSVRHKALPIAVLGLLGGFATPTLLSTGSDRPIALFSYLLLLDGALLFVAHRRRWPALALLGLGGTTLYQMTWMFASMGRDRIFLGIGVLAVFGVLFALVPAGQDAKDAKDGDGKPAKRSVVMRLTRVLAVLGPFAFALFFAADANLGPWFYPTGGLLLMLSAGALFVGHREGLPVLGLIAAAASTGVLAVFLMSQTPSTLLGVLEVVGFGALLGVLYQVALERSPTRPAELGLGALLTAAAPLGLTALAAVATPSVSLYPWLAGWAISSALIYRQGTFSGRSLLVIVAPVGTALALAIYSVGRTPIAHLRGLEVTDPSVTTLLAILLGAVTLFSFVPRIPRLLRDELQKYATIGALVAVLIVFFAFGVSPDSAGLPLVALVAGALLFQLVGSLDAARLHGAWLFALHFVAAIVLTIIAWGDPRLAGQQGALVFAGTVAAFLLALAAPHLSPRLLRDPWAHRAAAVAGPLFFLALHRTFDVSFGDSAVGVLPLGLAAAALGALVLAKGQLSATDPARRVSIVWFAAVVAGFVTLAIPLQLDREWITVAWALEGAALIGLYVRLEHPGLKYIGVALLTVVTVRLVANPYLLDYHMRAELPGVVWLSYTFLVPAACLIAAHFIMWRHGPRLMTAWERSFFNPKHRIPARGAAIASIVVIFVYLNLVVFDLFGTGPSLTIPTDHMMARDLTTSLVWALYGLSLLALGVGIRSTGLRAMSLALFLLTAAKVFLYDLSHLEDLYRVGSLVGLAMSLIIVSLAYQRFVFRTPTKGVSK
ncbi:MAG: hypothetical protein DRJ42_18675 [Deltaproteobacteria bacterium]|nr:MAG: hypothetical protein DRJ42_18675 [Deltaproteobacteria bacterium]